MSKGPFIYTKVKDLENKSRVNTGTCAGLVQWHTRAGHTSTWVEGIKVKGNGLKLKSGTAIATFVDGKYPNNKHGNHAALYISQSVVGIEVMDQWLGVNKPKIGSRILPFLGKKSDGTYIDPSNNGDAFSVIMHD